MKTITIALHWRGRVETSSAVAKAWRPALAVSVGFSMKIALRISMGPIPRQGVIAVRSLRRSAISWGRATPDRLTDPSNRSPARDELARGDGVPLHRRRGCGSDEAEVRTVTVEHTTPAAAPDTPAALDPIPQTTTTPSSNRPITPAFVRCDGAITVKQNTTTCGNTPTADPDRGRCAVQDLARAPTPPPPSCALPL